MNPEALTPELLRRMPLPAPEAGGKDGRGSVFAVAGSAEVPGSALLAGVAALRAGAGRLRVATAERAAIALGVALPEARVFGLAESGGDIDAGAAQACLCREAGKADATLIGPGMGWGEPVLALAGALCPAARALVLDAAAISGLRRHAQALRARKTPAIVTPHAGEMARLLERSRDAVEADPLAAGREAAGLLRTVVVMKGAKTQVIAPDGDAWLFEGGCTGLATSGSGDVLAGLLAGLLARGAAPLEAALWAVYLHGEAGSRLAGRAGPIGFLAREISGEVPAIMREMTDGRASP